MPRAASTSPEADAQSAAEERPAGPGPAVETEADGTAAAQSETAPLDPWTQPSPDAAIVGYRLTRSHAIGARRHWAAGHETADRAEIELFARTGAAMEPIWG